MLSSKHNMAELNAMGGIPAEELSDNGQGTKCQAVDWLNIDVK